MYRLLLLVFALNLLSRCLIGGIDETSSDILYILSRFFLIAFVLYIWYYRRKTSFSYSIITSKKWLIVSILLLLMCFITITRDLEQGKWRVYVLLLIECLSVSILEELLFRHITFNYFLNKNKSYKYAIVITSLLFALFHVSNLFFGQSIFSTINQIEIAFLLALFFQFIYLKTKNLTIVVALHTMVNFVGTRSGEIEGIQIKEQFMASDFLYNQVFIFIIYIIFIPLYYWALTRSIK